MENPFDLENVDDSVVQSLSIDELKESIKHLMTGLEIETPVFNEGTFFYRARTLDENFNKNIGIKKSDLSYCIPQEKARMGRANRSGKPMFYCSLSKEPVFFELQNLTDGDELILGFWQSNKKIVVNNIGYTQLLFEKLGAKRKCPTWSTTSNVTNPLNQIIAIDSASFPIDEMRLAYSKDKNQRIRSAMSDAFMCYVDDTNDYRYKLSVALAELHLGGEINNFPHQFAGLLYPSLRVKGDGDNLALLPEFVDKNLEFKKAVHIRIEKKEDKKINITYLDYANSFFPDGNLRWLGRLPSWEGKDPALATFVAGVDNEGDYLISTDGIQCHWVVTDQSTKRIILPA